MIITHPIEPQPVERVNGWHEWRGDGCKATWHNPTWMEKFDTAPIDAACPLGAPGDTLTIVSIAARLIDEKWVWVVELQPGGE